MVAKTNKQQIVNKCHLYGMEFKADVLIILTFKNKIIFFFSNKKSECNYELLVTVLMGIIHSRPTW